MDIYRQSRIHYIILATVSIQYNIFHLLAYYHWPIYLFVFLDVALIEVI